MNYIVAEVTIPGAGIFFTARNDDRTAQEVVAHGVEGLRRGAQSPIYVELNQAKTCTVHTVFQGLNKAEAEAKKRTLIAYSRSKGLRVLNVR